LPVQAIETALVMRVLEPIWTTKPETASRLRGRIEAVLDWAKAQGYCEGENPARWRGHLANLLPARAKVQRVKHHAALPYAEIGAFMRELRKQRSIATRALEFAILTAVRTREVHGARWSEIDLGQRMWTVPPARTKTGRKEHRVPLSAAALAIIEDMRALCDGGAFIFPCAGHDAPLASHAMLKALRRMGHNGATVHGFRSCFRDWAAERTSFPREAAELALDHAIGSQVEAAYRRGDMFEKRRRLMEAWAAFCAAAPSKDDNVVSLDTALSA
jgi:integrase